MVSCNPPTSPSYEIGLKLCNQKAQDRQAELETFFFQSPDCLIGHLLPEINQKTIAGKQINYGYFEDKISIINFWFSDCAPCIAEIPGLNIIKKKFGTKHVNYLAIGRDSKDDIIQILKQTPWNFDQIEDGNKLIEETFKLKWGYPTTFIVNKKLEIIHAFSGGSTGEDAIQKIQDEIIPIIDEKLK